MPRSRAITRLAAPGLFRPRNLREWVLAPVPALCGIGIIAFESTPMMGANRTSSFLYPLYLRLFGYISGGDWWQLHFLIRKLGHFYGYGTVSLLFYWSWRLTLAVPSHILIWRFRARLAVFAWVCVLLLSSWDEYHQTFLPNRHGSPWDVLLDMLGAVTVTLAYFGVLAIRKARDPHLQPSAPI
jgi:VanZ family protein